MLEHAIKYCSINWYVFPCENATKTPLTKNGFHDATIDKDIIKKWWDIWPNALIAVACGKSNICVLDLDVKDDRNGVMTWNAISKEDITTVEQITQSGGRQIIFKADDNRRIKQGTDVNGYNGIDTRNHGGYIIVPPSKMINDNKYEWITDQSPFEMAPIELPSWVHDLFKEENGKRKKFEIPEKLEKGNRGVTLFKMACSLKSRNDLNFNQVLSVLRSYNNEYCSPPISDQELSHHVESAFSYENVPDSIVEGLEELNEKTENSDIYISDSKVMLQKANEVKWDYVKKDKLTSSFNNTLNSVRISPEIFDIFRYNEFSKDIEVSKYHKWMGGMMYPGKIVDDNDLIILKSHLCKKFHIQPNISLINEVVNKVAFDNSYHPVKNYLNSLKWDRKKRLDRWLQEYCGVKDSIYTRFISWLIIVSACSRINKPGCKFDYMTIFEGDQGIGKSQAVNILGGQWTASINIMARDKDTIDKMRGKWIVEVPEMASFKKQEIEDLKAFIAHPIDRVRLAYARRAMDFPRQCIFVCTINQSVSGYLKDDTGNRRFFPVRLGKIDLGGLQRNRDMLFAEGWMVAKNNPTLYPTDKELLSEILYQQSERELFDEMTNEVAEWLKTEYFKHVKGIEVYKNVFKSDESKFNTREQRRVGLIMKKLGWVNKSVRGGNSVFKAYVNPAPSESVVNFDD